MEAQIDGTQSPGRRRPRQLRGSRCRRSSTPARTAGRSSTATSRPARRADAPTRSRPPDARTAGRRSTIRAGSPARRAASPSVRLRSRPRLPPRAAAGTSSGQARGGAGRAGAGRAVRATGQAGGSRDAALLGVRSPAARRGAVLPRLRDRGGLRAILPRSPRGPTRPSSRSSRRSACRARGRCRTGCTSPGPSACRSWRRTAPTRPACRSSCRPSSGRWCRR